MQHQTVQTTHRWRAMLLAGLTALLAVGLVACSDDGETDEGTDGDVPNVSVTPLQPESEGTGVPRPQDATGTIPAPTVEGETPATSGEVTEVVIGDDLVVEDMTISAGDSVTWINEDDTSHTITSADGGNWATAEPMDAEIAAGERITQQFTTPGEYPLELDAGDVTWTVTVE